MIKNYTGSAVPRHFVFVLGDGTFVVQWDDTRVQDILSGKYHYFEENDFGHAITEAELQQLKAAGRVEHYNYNYVWLNALPEQKRFKVELKTQERIPGRVRVYYLNTTLPKAQLEGVQNLLNTIGMSADFSAYERQGVVAIAGKNGVPFRHLSEAEHLQKQLSTKAQAVFKDTVIAFVETAQDNGNLSQEIQRIGENTDLATLIASQTDSTVTADKHVVLILSAADERRAVQDLGKEMKLNLHVAETGADALRLLEDEPCDLLIMDFELPDMHGWALLAKLKENYALRQLPIMLLAEHTAASQQSFGFGVVNVDVYLVKPVSKARLRQNIWMALKERSRS
jgi:CheY-like chemotaxis protein